MYYVLYYGPFALKITLLISCALFILYCDGNFINGHFPVGVSTNKIMSKFYTRTIKERDAAEPLKLRRNL